YYLFNKQKNYLMQFGLLFVLGGAIGNLIDRMRFGEVIDFISVDLGFWPVNPWPIFNIADAAITVGIIMLIIASIKSDGREKDKNSGPEGDRTDQD
ncbi:signal peptidase II, partial [bacterium]|nr:signal peptidase II [bacterium]